MTTFKELDLRNGIDFATPFTPSDTADIANAKRTTRLPVSIGGRDYVLDLSRYHRGTLPQFRFAQDPSPEPGEHTLAVEGVWKRTQFEWHHGAGQEFADDTTSDRARFYASRHVDVWTKRRASLLHDVDATHSGNPISQIVVAGVHVYIWDGVKVYAAQIANSGQLAAPSWVDQTVTHTPVDMCTDGDHVFFAMGASGIYKATAGTPTPTVLGAATNVDRIWFVNGWLLMSDGPSLYSVSAAGVRTLVYTHLNAAWAWKDAAGAPNAIYVMGRDSIGTHTDIFKIVVSDDGATLKVPVFAGDLPTGEKGSTLFYYQARLCIGSDQGARFAAIDTTGALSVGPVVPIGQVNDFAAYGRYVWAAGVPGLWRFDLSNETESLVPPYAADLEKTTSPQGATKVISTVMGILFVDSNLYAPSPTRYCASGTITSGWFGFSSPERKVLSSGSIRTEPLPGNGAGNDTAIQMDVSDDGSSTVTIGLLDTAGVRDPGAQWSGQSLDSEVMKTTLTLFSSATDHTATPIVKRMTMRVLIAPLAVEEIFASILIADRVSTGEAKKQTDYLDPFDEFRFLKSLENSRQVVDYREGQITYRVTVRDVAMEKPQRWTDNRRFLAGTLDVRLVTEQGIPPDTGEGN